MKKLALLLIGLIIAPTLFLTSCDKGDEPGEGVVVQPSFDVMKNYMVANDMDIPKILTNSDGKKFVVGPPATAADVDAFVAQYYIMDIRSEEVFNQGHIQGANFTAFSDILTEAPNAGSKPILVVCYSGQTACYATALLRLYGYDDTRALKWGMSGWNPTTAVASWDKKIGEEEANGHANWSMSNVAPNNILFDDPNVSTSGASGDVILKKRVEDAVAAGFGAAVVGGTDVLNNPNSYFINNYFSANDYGAFGHIDGAYRIQPLTIGGGEYENLDPNGTVVTYCYTGQTSAVMTACLRVLGYNAKSLIYGMNGMYNTNPAWSTNQWGGDSNPKNLPLVQ